MSQDMSDGRSRLAHVVEGPDLHVRVIDAVTGANSPSTPAGTTSPPADHPDPPLKALARTHESSVRAMPMSFDITLWARQGSNLRPLACKQGTRERCADLHLCCTSPSIGGKVERSLFEPSMVAWACLQP